MCERCTIAALLAAGGYLPTETSERVVTTLHGENPRDLLSAMWGRSEIVYFPAGRPDEAEGKTIDELIPEIDEVLAGWKRERAQGGPTEGP